MKREAEARERNGLAVENLPAKEGEADLDAKRKRVKNEGLGQGGRVQAKFSFVEVRDSEI